ncbi:MAG: 2-succinyl-5-enolpyruvyl-6-hydroxy-3-cyclohexene-1-carboxylic-acid synthase [Bacteroidales bacterium]|jgi:2-succinyl-5-enolpyruvyl-6-hydroxy-3-cyclohexene-1-carboxylate synthase|nr:2-succinyl-5-enolpyruvyl-6-hydroxy-3-cyclohexene-1-carboxylic-acid synthase [Bacteroidales bacterium]
MAYSVKKHIQQLIYLLKIHSFTDVVVCPGSRNMPIVESMCCGDFNVHRALDERSAGFMTLGLAQTGRKVAVCVTSGSAVANLLPALVEAQYQGIGMAVVTADRPKEMIGQMMGQTMWQTSALASAVKYSVDVEDDESADGMWFANREINAALNIAYAGQKGPVQINMQIKEPFFECTVETLPECRKISLIEDDVLFGSSMRQLWEESKRPLVMFGQYDGINPSYIDAFIRLGVPFYTEVLSNIEYFASHVETHGRACQTNNNRIPDDKIEKYNPDFVIYIGGHIVSKVAKAAITKIKPQTVVRVSKSMEFADTFKCMTHLFVDNRRDVACYVSVSDNACNVTDKEWMICSRDVARYVSTIIHTPMDATKYPSVYSDFLNHIAPSSQIFLANSTTVRAIDYAYWNMPEAQAKRPRFFCNRGVNGIEGSMSAAIGYAGGVGNSPVYLVIGDLSFFYDVSSLWSVADTNLRILLVNDGKGSIFTKLAMKQTEAVKNYVAESHDFKAEGICESYRIDYKRVEDGDIPSTIWEWYFSETSGARLLEVIV